MSLCFRRWFNEMLAIVKMEQTTLPCILTGILAAPMCVFLFVLICFSSRWPSWWKGHAPVLQIFTVDWQLWIIPGSTGYDSFLLSAVTALGVLCVCVYFYCKKRGRKQTCQRKKKRKHPLRGVWASFQIKTLISFVLPLCSLVQQRVKPQHLLITSRVIWRLIKYISSNALSLWLFDFNTAFSLYDKTI